MMSPPWTQDVVDAAHCRSHKVIITRPQKTTKPCASAMAVVLPVPLSDGQLMGRIIPLFFGPKE